MRVKMLDDAEFEALPYPEMSTSVGVADPKTRTAYVRKTHIPILDAFNLAHELEHLKDGHDGVHADHYRNGVYYKGAGEIFGNIGSAIPGPWQPFAMAGSAVAARRRQKREQKRQGGGFFGNLISEAQDVGQGGPMDSFQGEAVPQSKPNIVTPGSNIGGVGTGQEGSLDDSIIHRIRGFFSGRNPEGVM